MLSMRKPILMLLAATMVAGCSTTPESSEDGEPQLPAQLKQIDPATFSLPLDAFSPTDEEHGTLSKAQNMLVARCLAKFGFTIELPDPPTQRDFGKYERRYLLANEKRAQTVGYKVPEITGRSRTEEPDLPPAAGSVVTGRGSNSVNGLQVPEGGCLGEARRQLNIDFTSESSRLVQLLEGEAYDLMLKDSRVTAAIARWSTCMKSRGFDYKDPAHANNDPAFSGTATASPQEIATATADVTCKKETNIVNVMAAVETAHQQRLMAKNQERLAAVRKTTDDQVRRATQTLAGK